MIPGITTYTQYREEVVAIVLPTLLFLGVCAHLCTIATHYCMPEKMQPRMLVSAFVLHAGMHAMMQCSRTYIKMSSRIRQTTSHTVLFLPLCYLSMLCVYFLAFAGPAVMWDIARSPKDILVAHALVAFLPEMVGTLFAGVMSTLRKTLDTPVEQS